MLKKKHPQSQADLRVSKFCSRVTCSGSPTDIPQEAELGLNLDTFLEQKECWLGSLCSLCSLRAGLESVTPSRGLSFPVAKGDGS